MSLLENFLDFVLDEWKPPQTRWYMKNSTIRWLSEERAIVYVNVSKSMHLQQCLNRIKRINKETWCDNISTIYTLKHTDAKFIYMYSMFYMIGIYIVLHQWQPQPSSFGKYLTCVEQKTTPPTPSVGAQRWLEADPVLQIWPLSGRHHSGERFLSG